MDTLNKFPIDIVTNIFSRITIADHIKGLTDNVDDLSTLDKLSSIVQERRNTLVQQLTDRREARQIEKNNEKIQRIENLKEGENYYIVYYSGKTKHATGVYTIVKQTKKTIVVKINNDYPHCSECNTDARIFKSKLIKFRKPKEKDNLRTLCMPMYQPSYMYNTD